MARAPLFLASQKLVGLSGKVILVRENARRLAALGWPVTVLAQRLEDFDAPGVERRRIARPWAAGLRTPWFTRRVRALARRRGGLVVGHGESLSSQDVLHVHNAVHRAHEARTGQPLTPEVEPAYARLQRRLLEGRRFAHVVANSELVRQDLVRRFGLDPRAVTVVHPGYDDARFRPGRPAGAAELRRALGADAGVSLVGLVTSGDFEKRAVGPFLRALGGLDPAARARLRVVVVGRESRLEPYVALAREAGLEDRVTFLEPRPDVESIYHALDLYVHPAPFEEFGMTVLEAMACGVPVLTTTTVGAAERLAGPARGELLEGVDVEGLRAGIARLLADPDRRRRLAEAGLAAARGATWDANVRGHVAVYERVLSDRLAGARSSAG